jgi:hypothetical protein
VYIEAGVCDSPTTCVSGHHNVTRIPVLSCTMSA